jgi:NitT/TauT family transport system permease protein
VIGAGALRAGAAFATFLGAWWLAVLLFGVPAFLLPAPDAVLERLWFLLRFADLGGHAATTAGEIAAGFIIGGAAGVAVGALFARWPVIERLGTPPILVLQTAPKIAIAPLLVLWFGLGPGPKVLLVAIVTFFPVMAGAIAGLRGVEPAYRDLARVLELNPITRALRIDLPFAAAPVAAGLRIASTQAVTAAVIGELMGANRGLGYLLSSAQESADTAAVIGIILILALIGWACHEAVRAGERRLLAWHPSQRVLLGRE